MLDDDADDDEGTSVEVSLCLDVNQCECCGKDNLKRTIKLSFGDGATLYLGVICASQWFEINMSGNPFYAADRLQRKIDSMSESEVEEIVDDIKEANEG